MSISLFADNGARIGGLHLRKAAEHLSRCTSITRRHFRPPLPQVGYAGVPTGCAYISHPRISFFDKTAAIPKCHTVRKHPNFSTLGTHQNSRLMTGVHLARPVLEQ